jgi:MFS family permease
LAICSETSLLLTKILNVEARRAYEKASDECLYAHCDAALATGPASARETRHSNWLLTTTILASSLAFLNGSVVNIGLPSVGATFKASPGDLQWVINAYLLPLSALLLLGGAAGDRFGRVRLLIIGTAIFGGASIACALAPSLPWLLVGRSLQGVGAALLMPNSLAILGAAFSGEARGRAIGIWASMGAVMGALGPVLGGWLIDTVGWRSIFLINLPLATAAIVLAIVFVRDARREDEAPTLDLLGGLLATAALGAITWGLTIGSGHAGWTPAALLLAFAGVALMLSFLAVEWSKGEVAMMPLTLFGSSSFIGLTLLTLFLYGALVALLACSAPVCAHSGRGIFRRRGWRRASPLRGGASVSLTVDGRRGRKAGGACAAIHWTARGCRRLFARPQNRASRGLLDNRLPRDPGDCDWHGWRSSPVDRSGLGIS